MHGSFLRCGTIFHENNAQTRIPLQVLHIIHFCTGHCLFAKPSWPFYTYNRADPFLLLALPIIFMLTDFLLAMIGSRMVSLETRPPRHRRHLPRWNHQDLVGVQLQLLLPFHLLLRIRLFFHFQPCLHLDTPHRLHLSNTPEHDNRQLLDLFPPLVPTLQRTPLSTRSILARVALLPFLFR